MQHLIETTALPISLCGQVLVHAAAGGVGQAALRIVAAAGGRAVATAGAPQKRAAVRAAGARAVAASRDTSFAEVLGCGGASGALPQQAAASTPACAAPNIFPRPAAYGASFQ